MPRRMTAGRLDSQDAFSARVRFWITRSRACSRVSSENGSRSAANRLKTNFSPTRIRYPSAKGSAVTGRKMPRASWSSIFLSASRTRSSGGKPSQSLRRVATTRLATTTSAGTGSTPGFPCRRLANRHRRRGRGRSGGRRVLGGQRTGQAQGQQPQHKPGSNRRNLAWVMIPPPSSHRHGFSSRRIYHTIAGTATGSPAHIRAGRAGLT